MKPFIFLLINFALITMANGQFLSHLQVTQHDPLYTTYAAALQGSSYTNDQGYQFQWFDDEAGIEFVSRDGPNMGMAIRKGTKIISLLRDVYREPVVTVSYSDLVRYYYYPVENLKIEVSFAVISSQRAMLRYRLINEGRSPLPLALYPYVYLPSEDTLINIRHDNRPEQFGFRLKKPRDGWMKEHDIPLPEDLSVTWSIQGMETDQGYAFARSTSAKLDRDTEEPYGRLIQSWLNQKRLKPFVQGLVRMRSLTLYPGDTTSITMTTEITENKRITMQNRSVLPDEKVFDRLQATDEKTYAGIPRPDHLSRDELLLYYSAFTQMRQCMMPPEGKCSRNYYIFSREPKWGWGYGGQVFHESLCMLAYVHMDPDGAMNSQRVFMERQDASGYIPYRVGPWLDERIETDGRPTSSAPWFNYENLEIFLVTGDRQFLRDAYQSGKRFYRYYVANRDSNGNGLCEWGGHAVLESVRDARVAVWDHVGPPSAFEGPDINSMLVKEAFSLGRMARLLNIPEEARQWDEEAGKRSALIRKFMWDPETRFFYNISRNDQSFTYKSTNDLKIREIIGFLPLWAGVADTVQARDLIKTMTDSTEFWRPYGVPTLSAAYTQEKAGAGACAYNPMGYWNGPVWIQWNYLLYRGLKDYGYGSEARQIVKKVTDNMIWHLKNDHVFWEFYSPDDRQAGWNKTYIWAGIVAGLLIDSESVTGSGNRKQPD